MSNFKALNLNTQITAALEKKGYLNPTPIQLQAIPHLLQGSDLLGIAQTGTGKTAAFALPILDNLFKSNKTVKHSNVRALILTPTRELASQIVDNIKLYGKDLNFKSGVIFGGVNINNQIKVAKQGFDILVATPGRLLDLINQGHIKFYQLEIFVLDEADRMLDMGFINDVKKIISKLPKQRQTLLFSATMPKDISLLADSILNNPVRIEVTPASTTVEKIDQKVNLVEKANKPLLLKSIIQSEHQKSLFLVFSRTKHGANRIVEFLEKHAIKVAAIHGNKSQNAREKALDSIRQGSIRVLVATDIAARGIDIAGITHVINYDMPDHPESYVHRIGRTARAGKEGIAISFCDNSELKFLKDIEKLINLKLTIDDTHPFHGVKSTSSAKSSLDIKERPKSSYKSSVKSKPEEKNKVSYFSKVKKNHLENANRKFSKSRFEDEKESRFFEGKSFSANKKTRDKDFDGKARSDSFNRKNDGENKFFSKNAFNEKRNPVNNQRKNNENNFDSSLKNNSYEHKPRSNFKKNSERIFENKVENKSKANFVDSKSRFNDEFSAKNRSEKSNFKFGKKFNDKNKKPFFGKKDKSLKSLDSSFKKTFSKNHEHEVW